MPSTEKRVAAKNLGSSVAYLTNVANGEREIGMDLFARVIARYPQITPHMMRPDLFDDQTIMAKRPTGRKVA